MLNALRKLLTDGGTKSAGSAELQQALDDVYDEIRAKAAKLEALRRDRAARVLDATDTELDAIEASILAAEREIERLELAAARLEEEIPAAAAREDRAQLEEDEARARELDDQLAGLARKYDAAAAKVAAILQNIAELAREREQLPGACEHLRVPGWLNGPEATEIHMTRWYAHGAPRFAAVQLPSLSDRAPHWGDLPEFARPRPVHSVSTAPSGVFPAGPIDHVGLPVDPPAGRSGVVRRSLG